MPRRSVAAGGWAVNAAYTPLDLMPSVSAFGLVFSGTTVQEGVDAAEVRVSPVS